MLFHVYVLKFSTSFYASYRQMLRLHPEDTLWCGWTGRREASTQTGRSTPCQEFLRIPQEGTRGHGLDNATSRAGAVVGRIFPSGLTGAGWFESLWGKDSGSANAGGATQKGDADATPLVGCGRSSPSCSSHEGTPDPEIRCR